MQVLGEQEVKTSVTTYLCLAVSILFAIPVSSQIMDGVFRVAAAVIMLAAYINFILSEKPLPRIVISASIPALGWTLLEFFWQMWIIKSGKAPWKGGFLITIGGPAEVQIETFILLSLLIIQSYIVIGNNKSYKKVISYVAFSGLIFGIGSYLFSLLGIIEGFFIMRGINADVFWTPLKPVNVITSTMVVCVFLYYVFYFILILSERIIPISRRNF